MKILVFISFFKVTDRIAHTHTHVYIYVHIYKMVKYVYTP
jgi:hypothetical protein